MTTINKSLSFSALCLLALGLSAPAQASPIGILTDFSTDPTTTDSGGDVAADWQIRGGGAFTDSIAGGIWTASGFGQILDTIPLGYRYLEAFDVDLRWLSTGTSNDFGATLWVNRDPVGTNVSPVRFDLYNDGTNQFLQARHLLNGTTLLGAAIDLGAGLGFLDMTFAFGADNDGAGGTVEIFVSGVSKGTRTYGTFSGGEFAGQPMFSLLGTAMQVDCIGIGAEGCGQSSVVPIPAAVWLFGSGLIGLVGIARRKKSA